LDGGRVRVEGVVSRQGSFSGNLETGRFRLREGRWNGTFDEFHAKIEADRAHLRLEGLRLVQGKTSVEGSLALRWRDGVLSDSDPVSGNLRLAGAELSKLLADWAPGALPDDAKLAGALETTVTLTGTVGSPSAAGPLRLTGGTAFGEPVERANFRFRATPGGVTIEGLELVSGQTTAQGKGSYTTAAGNWRTGRAQFDLKTNLGALRRWVPGLTEGVEATARAEAEGEVAVNDAKPTLVSLTGTATVPQITMNGRPLGDATIDAASSGRTLNARLTARLLGSQVRGAAEWGLTQNNPGLGQARVEGLTLDNLRTLGVFGDTNRPLGARGSMDAEFAFRGPVFRPDQWTATARVTRLVLEPRPADATIDVSRFTLRNAGALLATIDSRGLTIDAARLVGEGTDLNISGALGLRSRTPWNLGLRGSFNLTGLSVLEPDLEATGVSVVDATVRGELYRPAITGQMEVNGASFRLRNVPNGLDQVTGLIRFDTYRASIERMTAQTGGGNLNLTGFVGFGGSQLLYRLQGDVQHVRVRYPEEVSTTFDGKLAMSGTSAQSLLSGEVTVSRLALRAEADIGGLLSASARSSQSTPTQNAFLRGMQLDVHVVTAPDAELQTSLTRDLQPQADLRVRGTAARPTAQGRATLSEGELTFFGTRYKVNRGEVNLFNPSRIEPVLNFDLETTVRGVVVNINLNGAIDKLNPSYRSDPPLQVNEIVSLLTLGRAASTPGAESTTPTTASAAQQSAGGGSLLGAAVTSPVSGRLQRLFGISRINIDPDLNSSSPQARLTIEQQISREIRLTYITNLNRNQNQVVRMQWDFSRDYSLIAVRDENGLFGVDFQIRKRF
jgi:translocation and assembly module TamB